MATSPRPRPAAALAGAALTDLDLIDRLDRLDRLLPTVLGRTAGAITVGPVPAARRAVRYRLARLGRRRRLRHSLGTGTLAAGLVAGGAHQLWSRALLGPAPAPAPAGTIPDAGVPAQPNPGIAPTPPEPSIPPPVPVPPPGAPDVPGAPGAPSLHSWTWDPAAGTDRVAADPAAIHAGGAWHVFTTSATHCSAGPCTRYRVPRFTGPDLAQPGQVAGDAMPDLPAWVDPGSADVWAPAVARIGDRYVLWFSATARPEVAGTADRRVKCLGAAVAPAPEGPFVPPPLPLRCTPDYWAIDPSPVEADGRWYLLWREDDAAHPTGRIVAAELTADGLALADPAAAPTTLLAGEQPWEDATPGPGIGPIENPAMAPHPVTGEWLLAWSANSWKGSSYATGLARCAGPLGPCDRVDGTGPWLRTHADLAAAPTPASDPATSTGAASPDDGGAWGPAAVGPTFGGAGGLTFATGPDGQLYALFHAYPGFGEHPDAVRAGWVARVEADPTGDAGQTYRLVPIGGNRSGDPSVVGV